VRAGRSRELEARFLSLQARWERMNRLFHRPCSFSPARTAEDEVMLELCRDVDPPPSLGRDATAPRVLWRCSEFECVDETYECAVLHPD
jgi:hypothetical protein